MMFNRLQRPLAALTLVALAACAQTTGAPPVIPPPPSQGGGFATNIVGIGDSLTAGTQSGTTLGVTYANPQSGLPGNLAPSTQENGWFALFFAQANGIALDPLKWNDDTVLGSPTKSPLPLINPPGIGTQLLPGTTPGSIVGTHLACDAFDQSAYSLNTVGTTRASLANRIYDLGIPGITMHEALTMTAPLTGPPPPPAPNNTCPSYPALPGDPTSGALQSLVESESAMFYPVLGSYATTVKPLTQVNVALALKPQVATVWLGANDMLKFIFSAGKSPVTDTPAQFQTDLTSIIKQLEAGGAKVLVANLPTVLQTPQFFQGGTQPAPSQSVMYYLQVFSNGAISAAAAQGIVTAISLPEPNGCGVGANGYLTESGMLSLLAAAQAGQVTGASCPLDTAGAGSGLGAAYLTDSFAATAGQLNAGYNQVIAAVAAGTGATLVDVNTAFAQLYAASNAAPYYYMLPGTADPVSLRFGGHLVSFDGLHPSNTGYALVANLFIQAADTSLGMSIAPVAYDPIYKTDPYYIPNPFAPGFPLAKPR
jgi:lysophospholipase L1-like esterase